MIVEFPNPDSLAECLIADELSRLRDEVKALRAERDALLSLIADDAFASSFQTMGQYRSALLKATKGGAIEAGGEGRVR